MLYNLIKRFDIFNIFSCPSGEGLYLNCFTLTDLYVLLRGWLISTAGKSIWNAGQTTLNRQGGGGIHSLVTGMCPWCICQALISESYAHRGGARRIWIRVMCTSAWDRLCPDADAHPCPFSWAFSYLPPFIAAAQWDWAHPNSRNRWASQQKTWLLGKLTSYMADYTLIPNIELIQWLWLQWRWVDRTKEKHFFFERFFIHNLSCYSSVF